jgi:CRP/FNR family cyclic AMP-dependent transcriptional regulator
MDPFLSIMHDLSNLFKKEGILRKFSKDEFVFYKGDEGNKVYFVEEGIVKIVNLSEDGKELIFAILHDGGMFGEMSILDQKPRSACAMVLKNSSIYEMDGTHFITFLKAKPDILLKIIKILSERVRDVNDFAEDTVFLNLSHRIFNRLLKVAKVSGIDNGKYIEIPLNFSQKELAGLVGCTRENLNKELKFLKDSGVIDYDKDKIRIYNLHIHQ